MKTIPLIAGAAVLFGGAALFLTAPADAADAVQSRGDHLRPVLAAADFDRNGSVTQAEYGRALDARLAARKANAAKRFARLDSDRDGALSAAEIAVAPRRAMQEDARAGRRWRGGEGRGGEGRGGGMLGRLFAMTDADRDGNVTQAEFRAGADRIFAALDTDRNGTVSAAERAAAQAKMRDRMQRRGGADTPPDASPDNE